MDASEAAFYVNNGGDTSENRGEWEQFTRYQKRAELYAYLHREGYTFFNIPALTVNEIKLLDTGLDILNRKRKR